ncbi:hypothetical protein GW17_00001638, partial [Ensete ventricosum]
MRLQRAAWRQEARGPRPICARIEGAGPRFGAPLKQSERLCGSRPAYGGSLFSLSSSRIACAPLRTTGHPIYLVHRLSLWATTSAGLRAPTTNASRSVSRPGSATESGAHSRPSASLRRPLLIF